MKKGGNKISRRMKNTRENYLEKELIKQVATPLILRKMFNSFTFLSATFFTLGRFSFAWQLNTSRWHFKWNYPRAQTKLTMKIKNKKKRFEN